MKHLASFFLPFIVVCALLGIGLRLIDYATVPAFGETADEFFYPWAGMTWIQTGTPKAWSWFESYPEGKIYDKWGTQYRIVSPWIEKPPLYTFLTGGWMLLTGARDIFDVRLSTLRLVPVFLGGITILLVGLVGKKAFNETIGALAALIYAITPTIVLANRFSLTENLLTPCALALVLCLLYLDEQKRHSLLLVLGAGTSAAAAVLTKNIGLAGVVACLAYFFYKKDFKSVLITGTITMAAIVIHPIIGYFYNWEIFSNVLKEYQNAFTYAGPPELINTLFLFPTVARKNHLLLDGIMLGSYVLFFTSPFWIIKSTTEQVKTKMYIILSFPYLYIILLALIASGVGFSFYGWHLFPLYPFIILLLAKACWDTYNKPEIFSLLFFTLFLGSSSVKFLLELSHQFSSKSWPLFLTGFIALAVSTALLPNKTFKQITLLMLWTIFIGISIFTSTQLGAIFPNIAQPIN